jgi:hypothetical protein
MKQSTQPKTFELPVSDCGCFVAGEIGPDCFDPTRLGGNKPYPSFGVIVWYEDKETAKAAFKAATGAHFK